jgi:hypothetical protein
MTARRRCEHITASNDAPDSNDPTDRNDPIDSSEPADPIDRLKPSGSTNGSDRLRA